MKGITLQEMSDDTVQQLHANYVRQPAFAHTEGTASAYTVTLNPTPTSLEDGFGITIVPHLVNEAEVTLNINELGALSLKDQKGKPFARGKLQVGKPYTFRKVGTDFLADSSGGSGDAVAGDIRAGKVATTDNGEIVGTMPTHSDVFKAGNYFNDLHNTYLDSEVNLDSGYYPENTKVRIQINDSNFKSENIKYGITIFGEEGSYIGAGNAAAGDIRAGKTASTDEGLITGNLVTRANNQITIYPSKTDQTLLPGIYNSNIIIKAGRKYASGSSYTNGGGAPEGYINVRGLGFTPSIVQFVYPDPKFYRGGFISPFSSQSMEPNIYGSIIIYYNDGTSYWRVGDEKKAYLTSDGFTISEGLSAGTWHWSAWE